MQVLHVDDEMDLLIIGKEFMEASGAISVETVVSGKAALERVARKNYDAIVSDYQMPGMDGITLLKHLRQAGNDIPFIIFSGKGREEVVIEAINNGADFYMQKGSDVNSVFAELQHKISQAVARKHAERRIAESEARLRAIIESSSDVVWEVDSEGIYTYLSPNSSVVLGRPPLELLGTGMGDLIADEDREAIWAMMLSAFEHGDRVSGLCYSMRKGNGAMMEVETSAGPILDFRGERMGFAGITKDVTPARRSLRRQQDSEQRFRDLFESMGSGAMVFEVLNDGMYGSDYIVKDLNRKAQELEGRSRDEVVGKSLFELRPRIDEYGIVPLLREVQKSGRSSSYPAKLYEDDNHQRWYQNTVFRLPNGEIVTIYDDVTEQRMAEARERESEDRYRQLSELAHEGVWTVDLDMRTVGVNSALAEILGRGEAALIGASPLDIVAPQDLQRAEDHFRECIAGERRVVELELLGGEGDGVYVRLRAGPLLDSNGALAGAIALVDDVTEIKHALAELKREEERFRSMVETTPDCLWELDKDYRLVYISPQAETITGFTPAEMIGEMLLDHVVEAEREAISKDFRERLLKDGGLRDFQCRALRKDGVAITLEANAIVMRSEGEIVGVRGQSRDASRRLATERALRNANARLSLLSSITRHDIMNQVMVLKGYLELQESMAQDERRKVNLVRIREAAEKIQEQLAFAKQYERMGLDEPTWIHLETISERLGQEAAGKGVACSYGPIKFEVYADNMLDKVFFNLLDNSIRHGKRVNRISLRAEEDAECLRIIYEDNGVGVAEKDRPKLFQRGFGSNTGMGLFLAKEILSITDFSITEDGTAGTGVRFTIRVPRGHYRSS